MNIEKELLQKVIDSILHGSTQLISETDGYGNLTYREVRINDLRIELVEKLARHLVTTDGFKQALERAFTSDVIKKMTDRMISELKWADLPYDVRRKLEEQMKAENVSIQKFKMTLEVVEKNTES